MPYPIWPAALSNPRSPLQYTRPQPLATGRPSALGMLTTERNQTRNIFSASPVVPIEGSLFQTFLTFWRVTLNNGKAIFTAPWIADLGHPGYVARMPTFSVGMNGVEPVVTLTLELVPDVRLDPTDTFPDPWPAP